MSESAGAQPEATVTVKSAILVATGLSLLASPLVSAGMADIARDFADQATTDPVAVAITALIGWMPGEVTTPFLIKFILLSIPALFIAIGSPIAGWWADRFGRRHLLIGSTVLFAVAGASGALVSSLAAIFVGRALLGLAAAGMKTSSFAMTGDLFDGEARQKFVGMQGSAMKIGGFAFLYFGGLLAAIHWKVGFWGYGVALLFVPLMFMAPETKPAKAPEQRAKAADAPAIPRMAFADILFASFSASVLFFMTIAQAPFFAPQKFGVGAAMVGFITGTANLVAAASALTFPRFKARLSYPGIFAALFAMMAVGYFVASTATTFAVAVVGFAIAGVGFGLIVPAQTAWMLAVVPPARRGLGIGVLTTAMFMGQFFCPILIQPFIDPDAPSAVFMAASQVLVLFALAYGVRELLSRSPRRALASAAAGFIGMSSPPHSEPGAAK